MKIHPFYLLLIRIVHSLFLKKGLKIARLNINHLSPKIDELRYLLNHPSHPVDIIGISETFLNDTYKSSEICITNFSMIRKDRPLRNGGGLVIYLHNSIKFKYLDNITCDNLETIWIQIENNYESDFILGYVYRTPNSGTEWFNNFEKQLENVMSLGLNIVMMGDFNVDLLSNPNNKLTELTQAHNLTQVVDTPTRITQNTQTLIDHKIIYVTMPISINEMLVPKIGISDHYPTCITYKHCSNKQKKIGHTLITYRDTESINMNLFLNDLQAKLDTLSFSEDVSADVTTVLKVLLTNMPPLNRNGSKE